MRTPATAWRRALAMLAAATVFSTAPVGLGGLVVSSAGPAHPTGPAMDVDPGCGSACPNQK